MEKEIVNQVQEAQRVPYRINPRRNMTRHMLIKLTKTKHKNIKSSKGEATSNIKGKPHMLNANLSAETLQARSEWQDIFKVLKWKNVKPRVLEWVAIAISKLTNTKHKERLLKAAREKQQVTYEGNPIRLTADLSADQREWQDIFKVLKGKNLQPRLLYSARISFKVDKEIKSFSDKQNLR